MSCVLNMNRQAVFKLCIVFISILSISATKSCVTVDNREGNCVPAKDCSWILAKAAIEPDVLRRSECGIAEDLTPLICCRRWRNSEECGKIDDDKFPWVVDVLYQRNGKSSMYKCSGSLINEEYILTVAHCVMDMPLRIKPHKIRVKQGVKYKDYEIQSSIVHPEYSTYLFNKLNDIALLRLAGKVEFSELVQPLCLPTDHRLKASQGQSVSIFSKGPSKVDSSRLNKRLITMHVRSHEICNRYYRDLSLELNENQLCVGGEIGKDACAGDSGGPLMFPESAPNRSNRVSEHRWLQIGLVSLGAHSCGSKIPGIYVNLLKYIEWIEAVVSSD